MEPATPFPFRKAFLYCLLISIGICAFVGIMAILSGSFGWFQARILLSTVTLGAASICGLACGVYLSSKQAKVLPWAGIVLTFISGGMILAGIWMEPRSESYWKVAASTAIFAIACGHLALLSMARLEDWFRWSLTTAYIIIFGVASLMVLLILFEVHETIHFQLLGVAAILDVMITISIPIFHRLSKPGLAQTDKPLSAVELQELDNEISKLKTRLAELEQRRGR
jgi:drug/metabolite transporter (DMT)-like permease